MWARQRARSFITFSSSPSGRSHILMEVLNFICELMTPELVSSTQTSSLGMDSYIQLPTQHHCSYAKRHLKCNIHKTKLLIFPSNLPHLLLLHPQVMLTASFQFPQAKNFAVTFDSSLSLTLHIQSISKSCLLCFQNISKIQSLLTTFTVTTLWAPIIVLLVYCSGFLTCLSASALALHCILCSTARGVLLKHSSNRVTSKNPSHGFSSHSE